MNFCFDFHRFLLFSIDIFKTLESVMTLSSYFKENTLLVIKTYKTQSFGTLGHCGLVTDRRGEQAGSERLEVEGGGLLTSPRAQKTNISLLTSVVTQHSQSVLSWDEQV